MINPQTREPMIRRTWEDAWLLAPVARAIADADGRSITLVRWRERECLAQIRPRVSI